jgi:hypothetical protein
MFKKLSVKSLKLVVCACVLPVSVLSANAIHATLEQRSFLIRFSLSCLIMSAALLSVVIPYLFIMAREYNEKHGLDSQRNDMFRLPEANDCGPKRIDAEPALSKQ